MRFTDVFIRRPVLATVVSLILLLLGLKAFETLSVRQFPEITYPVVKVTTIYPGASADLVKGFITVPLQNAIASADGVDYLTSVSINGVSTILAYLQPGFNVDVAAQEISIKVNARKGELPAEAEDPVIAKENTLGAGTLQYISFASERMTEEQITDYLSKVVQPVISTIEGVGEAEIRGQKTFAMRIWLDSNKMAAHHVTADEINDAIQRDNLQSAAGQVRGEYVLYDVEPQTGLSTAEEFEDIVIKSNSDVLVRLKDVARVELGAENYNSSIRFDGKTAIFIKTAAATNANPLEVAKRVRDELPKLRRQLPPGMELTLVFDTTFAIQRSIDEVVRTIFEATAIVILVIFLFLGSLRSVIIPVVTIPLSLVGVLTFMLAAGFSINLLTLLAMVLAIGLVVDDAIVVVENIQRHIEEGSSPMQAALVGAREIAMPVISMTITLAAVYAPLGFIDGLTGTLFTEFAYTLAGAVIVSGVIALTLSPMMCAKFLRQGEGHGALAQLIDRSFDRLRGFYERRLEGTLRYGSLTLVFAAMVIGSIYFLLLEMRHELAPAEDLGVVFVFGTAPQFASLDYMKAYTRQSEEIINAVPERKQSFIMEGVPEGNRFLSLVILKDWAERDQSAKQVQDQLIAKLRGVAGLQIYGYNLPPIPSPATGLPIQFALTSTASDEVIYQVAKKVEAEVRKTGKFSYAAVDLKFDRPQLEVDIDRNRAAQLGIGMDDIGETLATLLGENYVNRYAYSGHSYKVIPQAEKEFRYNPEMLEAYHVRTRNGDLVPLSTVMSARMVSKPNKLSQYQQLNVTYVGALPAPGVTMDEGIKIFNEIAKRHLPEGFGYDYLGASRQYLQEGNKLALTFLFSSILIFLVLAAQFESFRDPLIVMFSVPMSVFGALIPLALGIVSFNIYTQIGLITLIGLISKHGILIVDFANNLQRQGLSREQAVLKACGVRLRPILMTTAAMVFGVIPLIVADGAGSASRFHIGLVIIAGMTIGTLFTLFVVPVVYKYLARNHQAFADEEVSAGRSADSPVVS